MSADTEYSLTSKIPTGSWTLYFHSPEETKWTLNTFVNLGTMTTWEQFWTIIEALKSESFADGMFFMMRDPCPPLWENHQNIRGGCYSFRCHKKDAVDMYINYIIACMLGVASLVPDNKFNGISISPKRGFNIIKIWNTDAQKYSNPSDVAIIGSEIKSGDIMYTPFIQKKM